MESTAQAAKTTICVLTPHFPDCPRKDNLYWKRCNCRNALYIYEDGRDRFVSAKTRVWKVAERPAKSEMASRDPEQRRLREIEAKEEEKRAAALTKVITVADALARWVLSLKGRKPASKVHATFVRKGQAWATRTGITYLNEITPDGLDDWRGKWALDAAEKYNRMGDTTQPRFQTRLNGFLEWATRIRLIEANPGAALEHISAIASEGRQTIAMLCRRKDETIKQLLAQLDMAIAKAMIDDIYVDEVNTPQG